MRVLPNVQIPMRDGIRLLADVYLPAGRGSYPALLHRQHCGKHLDGDRAAYFAGRGYAVVAQDIRGRWTSGGDWYPFVNEGRDGFDTVNWIADQPWCDGNVGMYGWSYTGWIVWATAQLRPPALRAIVSTGAPGRIGVGDGPYLNGVLRMSFLGWLRILDGRANQWDDSVIDRRHLPLTTMDMTAHRPLDVWRDWVAHPTQDDYWQEISLEDAFAKIDVPALHVTGWHDGISPGQLYLYQRMTSDSPASADQALVVGPWDHGGAWVPERTVGSLDFGEAARLDLYDLHVRWYDKHLRGRDVGPMPRVRYFVMGPNEWREDTAWPPTGSSMRTLHFAEDGGLVDEAGEAGSVGYVFDPEDPVHIREFSPSHLERSELEARPDVLVFETAELDRDTLIAGKPSIELYAESDCADTDFFAWLMDHVPDGRSMFLAHGLIGARYRDGLAHPQPIVPGEVYRFRFELSEVAYVVPAGHRIAVCVTSSSFPLFARNPGTGEPVATAATLKVARNRVHTGRLHPSRIELPVLSR